MTTPPTPPTWLDDYFLSGYTNVRQLVTDFPKEKILNFEGAGVTVSDDGVNGQTIVTVGSSATATTTTASFTQPAVNSTVVVPVTSTSFLTQGMTVFIQSGGFYIVSSVTDSTHFVANNTGFAGNASPGATIGSGSLVAGSGPIPSSSVATFGAPKQTSGGVLDMTILANNVPWVLFIAGDLITLPSTMLAGFEYCFTHDKIRSMTTLAGGSPVTFQRPGGATYTIQDPDGRLSAGSPLTAASVVGTTDGANYRIAFDGGSPGVVRCRSSISSP